MISTKWRIEFDNPDDIMWPNAAIWLVDFVTWHYQAAIANTAFILWYTWSIPSEELIDIPVNIMWPNAAIWLVDFLTMNYQAPIATTASIFGTQDQYQV